MELLTFAAATTSAALVAAAGWRWAGVAPPRTGAVAVIAFALAIVGAVTVGDAYPWTNAVVAIAGVAGGIWLGGVLPPRARAMVGLLVLLSVLDASQLLVVGGTGGDPTSWFHLELRLHGDRIMRIGVADLVVIAAMATHARRRRLRPIDGILPGPLGLALSAVFAAVIRPAGGLVLVPFLSAGWLIVETMRRLPLRSDLDGTQARSRASRANASENASSRQAS